MATPEEQALFAAMLRARAEKERAENQGQLTPESQAWWDQVVAAQPQSPRPETPAPTARAPEINTYGMMSPEAAFQAGYSQRDLDTMRANAIRQQQQREQNEARNRELGIDLGDRQLTTGQPPAGAPGLVPLDEEGRAPSPEITPGDRIVLLPGGGSTVVPGGAGGPPASANPDFEDYWSPEMSGPTYDEWVAGTLDTSGGRGINVDPFSQNVPRGTSEDYNIPLIGFEGYQEQPFYQQQFADLRAQQIRNRAGEQAARETAQARQDERAQQELFADMMRARAAQERAANEGQLTPETQQWWDQVVEANDPWAWANLPDVQPSAGISPRPTEFELNPRFDWGPQTTGQEIVGDLGSIFSDSERVFLGKHPDYLNQLNLQGGRQGVLDWASQNPFAKDKGWTATINELAQNIYTPVAGGLQGPQAPPGYVAPL